jgi:hypothetical protein
MYQQVIANPETSDALDRSIDALRETLERAEARWRQLEARLADQDRSIRELQDEIFRLNSERIVTADSSASRVPELTEIVTSIDRAPPVVARGPSDGEP